MPSSERQRALAMALSVRIAQGGSVAVREASRGRRVDRGL